MEKTQYDVEDTAKLPSIPPPVAGYPPRSSHGSMTSITSETDSESRFGLSKKEIERLGRIRPDSFENSWSEVGFVLSICMAQILTVCGNVLIMIPPHQPTPTTPPCLPRTVYINRRKGYFWPCIFIFLFKKKPQFFYYSTDVSLANAYFPSFSRNTLSQALTCWCLRSSRHSTSPPPRRPGLLPHSP